jgi:hypothetical protein
MQTFSIEELTAMLWQTSREQQRLMPCGCSVLHVAARLNLSSHRNDYPAWRRT